MYPYKHIISRRVCIVVLCLTGVVWVPVLKDLEGGELFMYINAVQSYFSPPIGAVYLLAVLWKRSNEKVSFIHFSPLFHFYTLKTSKNQKGFLTFPGGVEMEHWAKMSYQKNATDFRDLQTVKCRSPKVIYCYQRRIQNLVKHLR